MIFRKYVLIDKKEEDLNFHKELERFDGEEYLTNTIVIEYTDTIYFTSLHIVKGVDNNVPFIFYHDN